MLPGQYIRCSTRGRCENQADFPCRAREAIRSAGRKEPMMCLDVRLPLRLAGALAIVAATVCPVAAAAATAEQAKAFSERAAAHIEQVGEERAFADFTRRDG